MTLLRDVMTRCCDMLAYKNSIDNFFQTNYPNYHRIKLGITFVAQIQDMISVVSDAK